MLLVITESDLRNIERAVVDAARNAGDLAGNVHMIPTISPTLLRMAAKIAVEIATQETVWSGAEELVIPKPKTHSGLVRMEA